MISKPVDLKISVVIPCLNEECSIGDCIRDAISSLSPVCAELEVIVVDNGCIDSTVCIATNLGARVVHCHTTGYGYALDAGIRSALGDVIVMGDGDGSYSFVEAINLVEPLLKGGCDLVLGDRFSGISPLPGAMPWLHRYVGNPGLTFVLNVLFFSRILDSHTGFRAFKKDVYIDWEPKCGGFEYASEMIVRAIRLRSVIAHVPVVLRCDVPGRSSKLRTFRDGFRHLAILLAYRIGLGVGEAMSSYMNSLSNRVGKFV